MPHRFFKGSVLFLCFLTSEAIAGDTAKHNQKNIEFNLGAGFIGGPEDLFGPNHLPSYYSINQTIEFPEINGALNYYLASDWSVGLIGNSFSGYDDYCAFCGWFADNTDLWNGINVEATTEYHFRIGKSFDVYAGVGTGAAFILHTISYPLGNCCVGNDTYAGTIPLMSGLAGIRYSIASNAGLWLQTTFFEGFYVSKLSYYKIFSSSGSPLNQHFIVVPGIPAAGNLINGGVSINF